MGAIHTGVPRTLALDLRDQYGLTTFVETGTWGGVTASWAAQYFEAVYTIELRKASVDHVKSLFGHMDKITFICGDSRTELAAALALADRSLIFLDAHWGPDLRYDRPDEGECPLLAELAAINTDGRDHVVIIDDARYFLGRPGEGHMAEQWPSYNEILALLEPGRKVEICDDVIVGIPWAS